MIDDLKRWVDSEKRTIDLIKSLDPKDRLDSLTGLKLMFSTISNVAKEFDKWLSNPHIAVSISDNEYRELFKKIRDIALEMLEIDIEHTEKMIRRLESMSSGPRSSQTM